MSAAVRFDLKLGKDITLWMSHASFGFNRPIQSIAEPANDGGQLTGLTEVGMNRTRVFRHEQKNPISHQNGG